jgi:hypothetical protein
MFRINIFKSKLSPDQYIQKYNSGTEKISNLCLQTEQATQYLADIVTKLKTYSYREQINFLLKQARHIRSYQMDLTRKDKKLIIDAIKAQLKYLILNNLSKPTPANFDKLLDLENYLTGICAEFQPDYHMINLFLEHKQGPITIMAFKELIGLIGAYCLNLYCHLDKHGKIDQYPGEDICQIFKTLASSTHIEHAIEAPVYSPPLNRFNQYQEDLYDKPLTTMNKYEKNIYDQIAVIITNNRIELERKQQVRAFIILGLFQDKLPMEMQLEIVEQLKPSSKTGNHY